MSGINFNNIPTPVFDPALPITTNFIDARIDYTIENAS